MEDEIKDPKKDPKREREKKRTGRFKKFLRSIYSSGIGGDDDIEVQRKIILLNILFAFIVVFLTPYGVIDYLQGSYLLSIFSFIAVGLMIITYFYVRHTGDFLLGVYSTAFFAGALFMYVLATGGVNNTGVLWGYIFPMPVMFLMGKRKGSLWMAGFFSLILLFLYLPGTPLLLTTYSANFKLRFVTTFFGVCVISFWAEWVRAEIYQKIARQKKELESALEEINTKEQQKLQLHEELMAVRKMEAVGTLAAGMAHELNNYITVVTGNAGLLGDQIQDGNNETAGKQITAIKRAANQIAVLSDRLLSFSRKQILQLKTVNINEIIRNNKHKIIRTLGSEYELDLILEPDLRNLNADPVQISQAIIAMVQNARDALPGSGEGRVVVKTKNVTLKRQQYVCLSIEDNGCGMTEEVSHKIFEPFFTTKRVGEGVGLGLSFVYGTVKQHEGWLDVSSIPGEGTLFNLFFPIENPG